MLEYKYYIGGEFKKSKKEIDIVNPVNEEVFAKIYEATKEDLDLALHKARIAQKEWRAFSFKERAKILREIAKAMLDNLSILAELETKEIGKPVKESLFVDIPLGADCFNYYACLLETLEERKVKTDTGIDIIKYDPYGVAGIFLPYNVPLMIFGFSCAAALAAGNALIIKPSEYGATSILKLAESLDQIDMPRGLISIITGKGEITGAFLAKSSIDIVSFTGSRNTLKKLFVESKDTPQKIICELGGSNLTVVFSDADREASLQNVIGSSFLKQGQMCIGTSVVLVQEDIYEDYIRALTQRVSKIKLGDPFLPDVGMGPLPTKEHLDMVDSRVRKLEKSNAKILYGGLPDRGKGYFYPPTIIEIEDTIYDEFFAPVILVKKFKDKEIDEIIEKNPTGLVLSIWTSDLSKAKNLANKACVGTVWINTFAQMSSQTPFGGTRNSGWGRNLGRVGFFEYVQPKHIGIGTKKSPVDGWFGI